MPNSQQISFFFWLNKSYVSLLDDSQDECSKQNINKSEMKAFLMAKVLLQQTRKIGNCICKQV